MKRILAVLVATAFAGAASAQTIFPNPTGGGGGSGTVTSVICGTGLTGGTITGTGTCAVDGTLTLTTPALGTPASGTLTNATGLPIVAGTTGTLSVLRGGTGTTTPAIVAGTNVTVSGTWPNQTVNASAGTGTVSYSGTANPGVSNDNTQGYSAGSLGVNTNTGQTFSARAVGTGTAAWSPLSAAIHPGYVASVWYGLQGHGVAAIANALGSIGALYCSPFPVHQRVTISQLGVRITTTSAGNGSVALTGAIYKTDPLVLNRPGDKVDSLATGWATGSATSVAASLNSSRQLEPGIYWFCVQTFDSTVRYAAYATGGDFSGTFMMGSATLSDVVGAAQVIGVSTSGTFGTWPSSLNGSTWTLGSGTHAVGAILVASVP